MPLQVSAIVLAAGSSRRMGSSKQLLPLGPKPVIRHCLDSIITAGILDIIVVLGASGEEIAAAVSGMPVKIAYNRDSLSEMAESVRMGMRELPDASSGVLVCLSDHPLVSVETVRRIIDAHGAGPEEIVIPTFQGKRGHPTLFPRKAIEGVLSGKTLRDVITNHGGIVRTIDVADEGVVVDMDTPGDYERIKGRFS